MPEPETPLDGPHVLVNENCPECQGSGVRRGEACDYCEGSCRITSEVSMAELWTMLHAGAAKAVAPPPSMLGEQGT